MHKENKNLYSAINKAEQDIKEGQLTLERLRLEILQIKDRIDTINEFGDISLRIPSLSNESKSVLSKSVLDYAKKIYQSIPNLFSYLHPGQKRDLALSHKS